MKSNCQEILTTLASMWRKNNQAIKGGALPAADIETEGMNSTNGAEKIRVLVKKGALKVTMSSACAFLAKVNSHIAQC